MHWDMYEVMLALIGGAFIATSSTVNLLLTGRMTGMSSIFYTIINWDKNDGLVYKVMFVSGLIAPVYIAYVASSNAGYINGVEHFYLGYGNVWGLLLGGLLVGIGTKLGNGCTSGHAVCGIPRLSKRSIVATILFVGFGLATATLLGHLEWLRTARVDTYSDWGDEYRDHLFRLLSYGLAAIALISGFVTFIHAYKSSTEAKEIVEWALSFILGVLFGIGLAISGMCNPHKILAFLTLDANWDPSLLFVMISAVGLNLLTFQLIYHYLEKPLLLGKYSTIKSELDWCVIVGPIVFGVGWGVSGLCPGPGILNLFLLPQGFLFILSLSAGQLISGKLILPRFGPEPIPSVKLP